MKSIFQQLHSRLNKYSTKELVNKLLLFQFLNLLILTVTGFITERFGSISTAIKFGSLFLTGLALMLITLGLFLIGLTLFVKKENPYTISQTLFGWKFFSYGLVPQLLGLFMMAISFLTLFFTLRVLLE